MARASSTFTSCWRRQRAGSASPSARIRSWKAISKAAGWSRRSASGPADAPITCCARGTRRTPRRRMLLRAGWWRRRKLGAASRLLPTLEIQLSDIEPQRRLALGRLEICDLQLHADLQLGAVLDAFEIDVAGGAQMKLPAVGGGNREKPPFLGKLVYRDDSGALLVGCNFRTFAL